jgi:hypothetical protein
MFYFFSEENGWMERGAVERRIWGFVDGVKEEREVTTNARGRSPLRASKAVVINRNKA